MGLQLLEIMEVDMIDEVYRNLCDTCCNNFPDCSSNPIFGCDIGNESLMNDNVSFCDKYDNKWEGTTIIAQ